MAAIVEHEMTRNQLLAAYLNAAYFENQSVGIEVAAERYFHTTAAHLTLTQSAMLAGMVENPSYYDPVTFPQHALARRNEVLQKMAQQGYITPADPRPPQAAPLGLHMHNTTLQSGCTSVSAQSAAFFCDYVLAALKTDPAYATAYYGAADDRRAEDLHHLERPGPACGEPRGQLTWRRPIRRASTRAARWTPRS